MFPQIQAYCDALTAAFGSIPDNRKAVLSKITAYIRTKQDRNQPIRLVYICTHNSRRSHFGQVWAQLAAHYYQVGNVTTYSGGTEATAFSIHAIDALKRAGFRVEQTDTVPNPLYRVYYDDGEQPVSCFSKVYDHADNPQAEFAAIMTCSDAEENCPFIPGVELRIGTTYDDPKAFDDTPSRDNAYDERCRQIALETLFVFSNV
jgi:arsenate reductase